jgi:hypothetical protein
MTRPQAPEPQHHWSGWPGAYCLDCGAQDRTEVCVADGHDLECENPGCINLRCPNARDAPTSDM